MWINFDIIQDKSIKHTELYRQCVIINCTYLNSHLLAAPREYVHHGLVAGLDWASFWSLSPSMHPVAMPNPVSCYLHISMGRVSLLTPSLLSGWLLTNVQVNNITTLHNTHEHIYITSALLFFSSSYTSSTLFGRPASSDSSRLTHW